MGLPRLPRPLFTRRECIALGRCPECTWHPPTQGHHLDCPNKPREDTE